MTSRTNIQKTGKHVITLGSRRPTKAMAKACGECQASCQSACKTSCTVGNQVCRQEQ